jgi:cell wall-associated NlpC family hydrolase
MARVVRLQHLRKGDLLFFRENGRLYSHVGIYAGGNEFIHAASSRGRVRIDSLLDPYWKERFLDARRL